MAALLMASAVFWRLVQSYAPACWTGRVVPPLGSYNDPIREFVMEALLARVGVVLAPFNPTLLR